MIGFSEAPRFSFQIRDQLPSFEHAFISTAVAYDQHFHRMNSSVGGYIMADIAGNLLNTYIVGANYAYQIRAGGFYLKMALNASIYHQSIQADNVLFPDMISSIGPPLPTGEFAIANTSTTTFDIGTGFMLYSPKFFVGVGARHLLEPEFNYITSTNENGVLPIKITAQLGSIFNIGRHHTIGSRTYISPNILLATQDNFNQINGGLYFGRGLFFGGLWFRHTFSHSDALIFLAGIKSGITKIGYSYDATVSGLQTAAGAHEISISFDLGNTDLFQKKIRLREAIECPEMFKP